METRTIMIQLLSSSLARRFPAAGTMLPVPIPFLTSCFVDYTPLGRPFSSTYAIEFGPPAASLANGVR